MPAIFPNQNAPDSVYRNISLGVTGQMVNSTGAFLTGGIISNLNVAARFLKIYDKATAATQADTPVMTIAIPASGTVVLEECCIPFVSGISVRATTGAANADVGAPAANEFIVNLLFRA